MKRIFLSLIAIAMLGYAFDPVAPFDVIKHVEGAGGGGAMDTTDPAFQAYVANHGGVMSGAEIIDSITDKNAEIDSAWTFKNTLTIHIQAATADSGLVIIIDSLTGWGNPVNFGLIVNGTGFETATQNYIRFNDQDGATAFYVSGAGKIVTNSEISAVGKIFTYGDLDVRGSLFKLGNSTTDVTTIAGITNFGANSYQAGTTFTNHALPTHPDSSLELGYPGGESQVSWLTVSDTLGIPKCANHPATATIGTVWHDTLGTVDTLWINTEEGWAVIEIGVP